jgi:DNA polymerase III epsilon subunit-like protein
MGVRQVSILIIDTETTGPIPSKARLVQVAAYHMDNDFTHLESLNEIVYPQGFEIPDEAARIHGITTAEARRRGSPLRAVLDRLLVLANSAVSDLHQGWLVAHNLSYDYEVLGQELARCGLSFGPLAELLPMCTMKAMTQRCALPGKWGKFKWPRLGEAFAHCGLELLPEHAAHTAMGDVLACRDIYIHGCRSEWWTP